MQHGRADACRDTQALPGRPIEEREEYDAVELAEVRGAGVRELGTLRTLEP